MTPGKRSKYALAQTFPRYWNALAPKLRLYWLPVLGKDYRCNSVPYVSLTLACPYGEKLVIARHRQMVMSAASDSEKSGSKQFTVEPTEHIKVESSPAAIAIVVLRLLSRGVRIVVQGSARLDLWESFLPWMVFTNTRMEP